jgi:hypothetical protein
MTLTPLKPVHFAEVFSNSGELTDLSNEELQPCTGLSEQGIEGRK